MTQESHYSAFHDPNVASLGQTLQAFEALEDETASRKARARAAVATFSRLANKPASDIPGQRNFVLRQFSRLKNRTGGLAPKSLANCKSELRYLLAQTNSGSGRSNFRPLSDDWASLRNAHRDDPVLWKLSRFVAFCSSQAIAPQDVTDATLVDFRDELVRSREIDKPDRKVRETVRSWNRLCSVTDVPLAPLSVSPRRVPRWTIEPQKFPAAFRESVAKWLRRLTNVDPEDETGLIRALRPTSVKLHEHQVFKAASALVLSGTPIETVISLSCLTEIDAFKALLKYLRLRQGGKPTSALYALAKTLKAIAKHELGRDDAHLARMKRVYAGYVGELPRTKSYERLKLFEDETLLNKLLHLPENLLKEASLPRTSPRRARTLAQIAVAIEIEWHAPLRRENLVALNMDTNIQPVTVQGEKRWIIRFDRSETKNRSLLTYELPGAVVRFVQRAFEFYTPKNGWLFPGAKESHKTDNLLGVQIKTIVEQRTGAPFHPHMMRGLVATMQTREHDNGLEYARAMLGDRSDRTVRQYYTATAEQHLIRKAQKTMQTARLRTAPVAPAPRKRNPA
jgi:integrase